MLRRRLVAYKTQLVNEATIWFRVIYPLLTVAERDNIRAPALDAAAASTRDAMRWRGVLPS